MSQGDELNANLDSAIDLESQNEQQRRPDDEIMNILEDHAEVVKTFATGKEVYKHLESIPNGRNVRHRGLTYNRVISYP